MSRKRTSPVRQETAGLYVRVSLDRSAHGLQDEILSPETQEDRGRAYCTAQGWAIASIEHDIDESAYRQHYSQRRGLMVLLEAVERGELTKLVVWKFSRLSRRLREFIEICDRVEAAGGGLVSVTEQVDTSTPAGRLIRNVLASFAQFQAEEISEQIFETWMTKAKRGERPPGFAPFGTTNTKGLLEPADDTHAYLLGMYRTFVATRSLKAVWDYLAAQKVPAPKADEWNLNTIRNILTNPIYVGRIDWAGEVFQGRWDPIVPEDLWNETQALFSARRTMPSGRRDARLLTGFLKCSLCGQPMWTRYVKRWRDGKPALRRVYWCCQRSNLRQGCAIPVVDGEEAEKAVWEEFVSVLNRLGAANLVPAMYQSEPKEGPASRRHQTVIAERERTEKAVAQLFDLLADGSITREQFRQQNQRYLDRLQTLQTELTIQGPARRGPTRDEIRAAARLAPEASTDEERRELMASMGVEIEAGSSRVHLRLLGLQVNLKARSIGDTFYFGEEYHRLDYQGTMLTDRQLEFIRRTYHWANKKEIAARIGRPYNTLLTVAKRMRRLGILNEASQ